MNPEQLIVILNIKMQFNIMQNYLYLYSYKSIILWWLGITNVQGASLKKKRTEQIGTGSLVGCRLRGRTEWDMTEAT